MHPVTSAPAGERPARRGSAPRERWLARGRRFFFGDDVFISYARADASDYALALADALAKAGFACFLDQWGTQPQRDLPRELKAALRHSGALVVIASPGAARSPWVGQEIALCREMRRPILPVSIDGAEREAAWLGAIEGLATSRDTRRALEAGEPGAHVVRRIENALGFRTRARRVRRAFVLTAAATAVITAASALWLARAAREAARQARVAASIAIANEAAAETGRDPERALRLALQAGAVDGNVHARRALLDVLRRHPRLVRIIPGHQTGRAVTIALSPDGSLLASGGTDGRVRVRDLRTLRELSVSGPALAGMREDDLAFSPDGRWLVGRGEGTLVVWRASGFTPATVLRLDAAVPTFGPGGVLAVATGSGEIALFRIDGSGALHRGGTIPIDEVRRWRALTFSPDGATLAIVAGFRIHLADVRTATLTASFVADSPRVPLRLAYSPAGGVVATSDVAERVTFWSAATHRQIVPWERAPEPIMASPAGRALVYRGDTLVTGSERGVIHSWKDPRGNPGYSAGDTIADFPRDLTDLAISGDGRVLASSHEDGSVAVWDLGPVRGVERELPWIQSRPRRRAAAFDGGGRRLLVNGTGGLLLWDTRTEDTVRLAPWEAAEAAIDPRGTLAVAAHGDSLYLWELREAGPVARPPIPTGLEEVHGLRFSPDGTLLAAWNGGENPALLLWSAATGRPVAHRSGKPVGVLAISPDNRTLALRDDEWRPYLYQVDGSGRDAVRIADAEVAAGAFVRGGRELLTYDTRGELVRWRLGRERPARQEADTLLGNTGGAGQRVMAMADMSADGRYLAVSFDEDEPVVWDLDARVLTWTPGGRRRAAGTLVLSGDGSKLIMLNVYGTRLYDLSPGSWTRRACSILAASPPPVCSAGAQGRGARNAAGGEGTR
ncbi:MAG TPA: toll/interleukin-1 receptor domain-containing protein [Longimicrobium sp.]|nr:toll/interleukin-1 receptor domain-containing protein [Longimicrobium sp.]